MFDFVLIRQWLLLLIECHRQITQNNKKDFIRTHKLRTLRLAAPQMGSQGSESILFSV